MATTTGRSPSIDALHEFFLASCAPYEPSGGLSVQPAIELITSPPDASEECSHEHALGFLFADEMKVVRRLQAQYANGCELLMKIYFARGCSNSIPPPPPAATEDSEVAKVLVYYGGVYEVLQPQVAKLRLLCDYSSQTVGVLCDTIQRIAAQENTHRVIPDVLLDSIVDVLDILLQMNQLHDVKTSLKNDFSLFKRAFKHVKGDIADPDNVAKEIQRLQEFVGSSLQAKNAIWDSLRHNLTSVKRYNQVVMLLVKQCLGHLESDSPLHPRQRFKFIRVLPYLVAVLHAEPANGKGNGIHGAEKKLVDMAQVVVGRYPALPIFADLCVSPLAMIGNKLPTSSTATKSDLSSTAPDKQWDPSYDLVRVVLQARLRCAEFTPRFLFAVNKVRKAGIHSVDVATASSVGQLAWEGLQLLFEWRTSLQLFLAMKYQRPRSDDQLEHLGVSLDSPYLEYQRVITHNFGPHECSAVMEMTHMIKGVANIYHQSAVQLTVCIRNYVYFQVQSFVQQTLVPIMHRADKKKHASVKILQEIRLMCGDWNRDEFPSIDYKKRRRERQLADLKKPSSTTPTRSQIQMLRTAVNAVYARRTSGEIEPKTSVFAFHRELKSSDIDALHRFYTHSASFNVLLDMNNVLAELSSFPELLFREVFLEITKSPQLPVDDSLPWLILQHTITEAHGDLHVAWACALLDVYNDAAHCALTQAQQVSVCDEVSAEAKLFFDHLVYLIADYAYVAAKSDAARMILGGENLARLQQQPTRSSTSTASPQRGSSTSTTIQNLRRIATARQVMVIDDPCDLMLLVSGHLNLRFMRDLASTVNKITRADATIFVATVDLIDVLRKTHRQLNEFFRLDEFDAMWCEASTSSAVNAKPRQATECDDGRSKLQRVVAAAIVQDLAVNFGFNYRTERFFRTPLPAELRPYIVKARAVDADSVAASKESATTTSRKLLDYVGLDRDCRLGFDMMHQSYKSFIGIPHIEAMLSLLSRAEVIQVVDDCIDVITSQIEEVVHLFVPVLGSAIPPYRLPKLLYRTEGCYGYFESKFKHMMDSKELEAHVFQCLRMIGNTLLVIQLMSQVTIATQVKLEKNHGNEKDGCPSHGGLLAYALLRLHTFLEETELARQWSGGVDSNPEQAPTSDPNPSTFFLVWNALEYLSCCPLPHAGLVTYREQFGEGVYFAGCTLVHLLGQRSLYELWNPSQYVIDTHNHDTVKNAVTAAVSRARKGRKNSGSNPSATTPVVGCLDPEMVENTSRFVAQATQTRQTAEHLFALLEQTWSPANVTAGNPSKVTDSSQEDFTPPQ